MASLIRGFALPIKKRDLFSILFNPALFLASLALFFALVLLVSPYSVEIGDLSQKNLPPSTHHFFGTDALGRDLLTRTAAGGAVSYVIIATALITDGCIGTFLGITTALGNQLLRRFLKLLFHLLTVIPQILLGMVLFLVTNSGVLSLLLTLLLTNWIGLARLAENETLRLSEECFFQSAICHGESFRELIFKTLLPHLKGSLLIKLTHSAARALYLELFLSYLGVGVPAPHASFGTLLSEGIGAIQSYPWRALFPMFFLFLLLFSLHALGDQLKGERHAS